ncbi:class I SAM-dependent DNA methyltransferase [Alkaliphilus serpentinus]|uniref:Class I SAM-dependent methyltransferase n=1 Tax=Alkaliphilus serpentinus TaxID=1482731 RepID=A0A833HNQ3_9FIRM|nr:class I SAM-dependent methyltransferase [Alkaliphilus serpentinus]KAB3529826.1 class I SAM-dependent methyltransferase [Alkaliphilus serpentinus]
MGKQYAEFAYLYDRLMEEVDYRHWCSFIEELLPNIKKSQVILELACGTGNLTLALAERGYKIIGVDISEDMLAVAKDKLFGFGYDDILLIQQDIVNLEINGFFDNILCACDGINYIIDTNDLIKMFKKVKNHLSEGGTFLFDISSLYKLKNTIGNNTFGENLGDLCYLWENYFDDENMLVEMDIAFFMQEGSLYRKYEEQHIQRAYSEKEIMEALKLAGFNKVIVYGDFKKKPPTNESERLFFMCSGD